MAFFVLRKDAYGVAFVAELHWIVNATAITGIYLAEEASCTIRIWHIWVSTAHNLYCGKTLDISESNNFI